MTKTRRKDVSMYIVYEGSRNKKAASATALDAFMDMFEKRNKKLLVVLEAIRQRNIKAC